MTKTAVTALILSPIVLLLLALLPLLGEIAQRLSALSSLPVL